MKWHRPPTPTLLPTPTLPLKLLTQFLLKLLTQLALFLTTHPVYSQTQLSGFINEYTTVSQIDDCEASLLVDNAQAFEPGTEVLLIQMQGANIVQDDNSSFGNLTNLNGAGFFERGTISTINGNTIFLENKLLNTYDLNGGVQLLTMPTYQDATVTDLLTAQAWDGSTGGVLAFTVSGVLTLEAPISVDGRGFRGGQTQVLESNCQWFLNQDNYFYESGNWRGALKGEGIATFIPDKEAGRGPQANGGGGANDHNAGGGGGSNTEAGGVGGEQTPPSAFGCSGEFPGLPGKLAPNEPGRIFMGGGGGAGHTDDPGAGSRGGNGGGIIIIQVESLDGNNFTLSANGEAAPDAGGDGAGGGGAGGSIILIKNTVLSDYQLSIRGGDGGSTNNMSDRCFGPGGGGSGGIIKENSLSPVYALEGGAKGINVNPNSPCSDPGNGAQNGQIGVVATLNSIPASTTPPDEINLGQQPASPVQFCDGEPAILELNPTGANITYQWQLDMGGGFFLLQNGSDYDGVATNALEIINPATIEPDWQFQCIVGNDCGVVFSDIFTLEIIDAPVADFGVTIINDVTAQFQNLSQGVEEVLWDFGDQTTSTLNNPQHVYAQPGSYTVTLTVMNSCGTATFSQLIQVGAFPTAGFSANLTAGCSPLNVQFSDLSTGDVTAWAWEFPGGNPATSTLADPSVTYPMPGLFPVTLMVTNDVGNDTLLQSGYIQVLQQPLADFTFTISGDTIFLTNTSTGNISTFSWNFGDGSPISNEENPTHIYNGPGMYPITLTVSNEFCASGTGEEITIQPVSVAESVHPKEIRIYPNPFEDFFTIQGVDAEQAIRVYNALGQLMPVQVEWGRDALTGRLWIRDAPAGVYFIQVGDRVVQVVKGGTPP